MVDPKVMDLSVRIVQTAVTMQCVCPVLYRSLQHPHQSACIIETEL